MYTAREARLSFADASGSIGKRVTGATAGALPIRM